MRPIKLLSLFFLCIICVHSRGQVSTKARYQGTSLANQNVLARGEMTIKLQLPGDAELKDYYVKRENDKYILNGDIEIPLNPGPRQIGVVKQYSKPCKTCSATADDQHFLGFTVSAHRWPDGRIPVEIDESVYATNTCEIVRDALNYINSKTCLIFYPRNGEDDYVSILVYDDTNGQRAGSSPVGKQGGRQTISMSKGRFDKYSLVHELMHAIGVYHEQSRQDRDNFINIDFSNVKDDNKHNFQIEGNSTARGKFDFCSIMQYSVNAFAIDPTKPVIRCGYNGQYYVCPTCLGAQTGLTDLDIQGVASYYAEIGVSRFPGAPPFLMTCKSDNGALNAADITSKIRLVGRAPFVQGPTGGPIDNTFASYSNGNPADGDGYCLAGKQNNSFFYWSRKQNNITYNLGVIRDRYLREGAERGYLGWPGFQEILMGQSSVQYFQHGYIYAPTNNSTFLVKGKVFEKYLKFNLEKSFLKFPKSDEAVLPNNNGVFQIFEGGWIYFKFNTNEAFVIAGEVFNKWAQMGWEKSRLGFPSSDFQPTNSSQQVVDNNAVSGMPTVLLGVQEFEHGNIQLRKLTNTNQYQTIAVARVYETTLNNGGVRGAKLQTPQKSFQH